MEKHIQRLSELPCLPKGFEAKILSGGMTNVNYLVEGAGEKFVARFGADNPKQQMMRFGEMSSSKAAFAAGVSPRVIHTEHDVTIIEYIEGKTLDASDVRNTDMLAKIVILLRHCHMDIPKHLRGPALVFWVFHSLRDYVATLEEGNSIYLHLLPEFLSIANRLEKIVQPIDLVFGHNDLLPANILDDGKRLWLIDWDYGGFNSPLFDLGGLASNSELSEGQETWLLETYYERPLENLLWRKYLAMKCASLLRETMWSMVSEIHSSLDVNFKAYTDDNLGRFQKAYASFCHG